MRIPAIRKKNADTTRRLLDECLPLLTDAAREVAKTTEIYGVDTRRGKGYPASRRVTVPTWTLSGRHKFCNKEFIDGGVEFAAYYLAHELAHIAAQFTGHSTPFMAAFKRLCPAHLQHYELIYQPHFAVAAGITKP